MLDHLLGVHPVHVVGTEDDDVLGVLVVHELSDWKIASALPVYHRGPSRCCAGTG